MAFLQLSASPLRSHVRSDRNTASISIPFHSLLKVRARKVATPGISSSSSTRTTGRALSTSCRLFGRGPWRPDKVTTEPCNIGRSVPRQRPCNARIKRLTIPASASWAGLASERYWSVVTSCTTPEMSCSSVISELSSESSSGIPKHLRMSTSFRGDTSVTTRELT